MSSRKNPNRKNRYPHQPAAIGSSMGAGGSVLPPGVMLPNEQQRAAYEYMQRQRAIDKANDLIHTASAMIYAAMIQCSIEQTIRRLEAAPPGEDTTPESQSVNQIGFHPDQLREFASDAKDYSLFLAEAWGIMKIEIQTKPSSSDGQPDQDNCQSD